MLHKLKKNNINKTPNIYNPMIGYMNSYIDVVSFRIT